MLWPTARLEKAFRLESEGVSSPLPVIIIFFFSFFFFFFRDHQNADVVSRTIFVLMNRPTVFMSYICMLAPSLLSIRFFQYDSSVSVGMLKQTSNFRRIYNNNNNIIIINIIIMIITI